MLTISLSTYNIFVLRKKMWEVEDIRGEEKTENVSK